MVRSGLLIFCPSGEFSNTVQKRTLRCSSLSASAFRSATAARSCYNCWICAQGVVLRANGAGPGEGRRIRGYRRGTERAGKLRFHSQTEQVKKMLEYYYCKRVASRGLSRRSIRRVLDIVILRRRNRHCDLAPLFNFLLNS